VDDRRLDFIEISESRDRLNDDRPRLLLRQKLVLFQIEVEVVALTVTKHCTEPVIQITTTSPSYRFSINLLQICIRQSNSMSQNSAQSSKHSRNHHTTVKLETAYSNLYCHYIHNILHLQHYEYQCI